ncbi:hypothetical protein BDY21DRAFT_365432 [Lineolata rhizophorae]|uniref:Uncharacterized protein n=1 Tax=Lineolata rhizophorae TaxID=578093 RepID=A0A6A6NW56_9PEZI|nr:hypothetical protein BDY21DRAFT_365432 [Lineolata rhizophorae]
MRFQVNSVIQAAALAGLISQAAGAVIKPVAHDAVLSKRMKRDPRDYKPLPISVTEGGNVIAKRQENTFDLRDAETFYWGIDGPELEASNPTANLTMKTQDENQHVLSTERFQDSIASVSCDESSMTIAFNDQGSYESAKEAWGWVNEADAYNYIMVTSMEGCSDDGDRHCYVVSEMDADSEADSNTIRMAAEAQTWEDAMSAWELHMDTRGLEATQNNLQKRLGGDGTIDINKDYSKTLVTPFDFNGVTLSVDCASCGLSGTIDYKIDADLSVIPPSFDLNLEVDPKDLAAFMTFGLNLEAQLTDAFEKKVSIFGGPIDLFTPGIPGVTIGPAIDANIGVEISEWTASATLTAGGRLDFTDNPHIKVSTDGDSDISGFTPEFSPIDPEIEASISATGSLFAETSLDLELSLFSKGVKAGLFLTAPALNAGLAARASSEGVCDSQKTVGVEVDLNMSADLSFEAGLTDSDPFFSKSLFNEERPIFNKCFGIGEDDATTEEPADEEPADEEPADEEPADEEPTGDETTTPAETISVRTFQQSACCNDESCATDDNSSVSGANGGQSLVTDGSSCVSLGGAGDNTQRSVSFPSLNGKTCTMQLATELSCSTPVGDPIEVTGDQCIPIDAPDAATFNLTCE